MCRNLIKFSKANKNPLFQPVATRCRRSRASMENSEPLQASSSSNSSSPAPPSQEENSSPKSVDLNKESKIIILEPPAKPSQTSTANTLNTVSAEKKPLTNGDSSATFSPFRKKLANSNILNRHREDEVLSPEIKRRGECTPSPSLRSSLANLSVEGSDDGRLSPVSPLLQRFNSRTSQYRSLNLKKTSERNQKILERLAEIRSRLPLNQSADKDSCKKLLLNRVPRQVTVNETPRNPSESVTAI